MNKAQLVSRVARETHTTKVHVTGIVDAFLDHISRSLRRGERASLVGFGTFTVARRRARTGRNPQTGEPITIAARRVVRFTPGKTLKSEVR